VRIIADVSISEATPAKDNTDLEPAPPKDEDPEGLKLIASTDGLEQAAKLLDPLRTLAADNIDVWIAIYDVAIRRSTVLFLKKCLGD
jgi:hypothetical protein